MCIVAYPGYRGYIAYKQYLARSQALESILKLVMPITRYDLTEKMTEDGRLRPCNASFPIFLCIAPKIVLFMGSGTTMVSPPSNRLSGFVGTPSSWLTKCHTPLGVQS